MNMTMEGDVELSSSADQICCCYRSRERSSCCVRFLEARFAEPTSWSAIWESPHLRNLSRICRRASTRSRDRPREWLFLCWYLSGKGGVSFSLQCGSLLFKCILYDKNGCFCSCIFMLVSIVCHSWGFLVLFWWRGGGCFGFVCVWLMCWGFFWLGFFFFWGFVGSGEGGGAEITDFFPYSLSLLILSELHNVSSVFIIIKPDFFTFISITVGNSLLRSIGF